jgi:type I restriction enzyme S subunit
MEIETIKSDVGLRLNLQPLGDIVSISKGKKHAPIENGKFRYINIENLHNSANSLFTNETGVQVEENDLIIAWDGANAGKVGVGFEGVIGSTLARLKIKSNNVVSRYLFWYLESKNDLIKSQRTGATIPHVNGTALKDLQIPLPPLATQKRIAEILDAADALRRKDQELLKKYDELAQAIFVDMFGDPVKNEKGIPLSELIKINPVKSELNFDSDLEVTFIPMSNVGESGEFDNSIIKRYSEVKNGFTYFKENDVLFAKITPCMENGKGAIAKNLNNHIGFGSTEFHVLRPNENLKSSFIYYLTMLDSFRLFAEANMTGSAGQKRVPTSFFSKVKIDTSKISKQDTFENCINNLLKSKLIAKYNCQDSRVLFESLIQKAFKGELVS